ADQAAAVAHGGGGQTGTRVIGEAGLYSIQALVLAEEWVAVEEHVEWRPFHHVAASADDAGQRRLGHHGARDLGQVPGGREVPGLIEAVRVCIVRVLEAHGLSSVVHPGHEAVDGPAAN